MKAVRAKEIKGLLFIAAAMVCAVLKQTVMKGEPRILTVGAVMSILGGKLGFIPSIIYE